MLEKVQKVIAKSPQSYDEEELFESFEKIEGWDDSSETDRPRKNNC